MLVDRIGSATQILAQKDFNLRVAGCRARTTITVTPKRGAVQACTTCDCGYGEVLEVSDEIGVTPSVIASKASVRNARINCPLRRDLLVTILAPSQ